MVSRQNDVVIAYGLCQEIAGETLVVQPDDLLCTAKIGFLLVAYQHALRYEMASQVARNFEDGNRSFLHVSANAYAIARFEMGIQLVAVYHIQRYGAVGKDHLARLGVDGRWVGLET